MSEPRGPFDDWLYLLAGELSGTFFSTGHPDLALEWLKKHLPIKLLEAAGKVDRQNAELVLCHITDIALGRHHEEWEVFYGQIRALLETLPEEKEEK